MNYVSLYRKWRPQVFSEVVGQEHVVRTLTNALSQGRIGHAYLFSGPRGTGKTTIARLLAKGLNCIHGPTGTPCGTCDPCTRIAQGSSVDVLEIDGASNRGIDEIREIRERVKYAPAEGDYKVYIIDEVHMLTTEAFNALLKVLEEPPSHVVFIFATTESHKIPATISSRCQSFDFKSLTTTEIARQLRQVAEGEGISISDEALTVIARHADGGMRDALGFLDQCIAFSDGDISDQIVTEVLGVVPREVLERLARALADQNVADCLLLAKESVDTGYDPRQFLTHATRFFRDLLLLLLVPNAPDIVPLTGEARKTGTELASKFGVQRLMSIIEVLGKAEIDIRYAASPSITLELCLVELAHGSMSSDLDALVARIDALERQVRQLSEGRRFEVSPTTLDRAPQPELHGVKRDDANQLGSVGPEGNVSQRNKVDDLRQSDEEKLEAPVEQAQVPSEPQDGDGAGDAGDVGLLQEVQQAWPKLLDALRARKAMQQAAFLREGYPGAAHGDVITIYFSPNHRFHQANIDLEKNRTIVETVLAKVLGKDLKIKTAIGSPPKPESATKTTTQTQPRQTPPDHVPPGQAQTQQTKPEEPQTGQPQSHQVHASAQTKVDDPALQQVINEPIVKAALEIFGGTITKIERKDVE